MNLVWENNSQCQPLSQTIHGRNANNQLGSEPTYDNCHNAVVSDQNPVSDPTPTLGNPPVQHHPHFRKDSDSESDSNKSKGESGSKSKMESDTESDNGSNIFPNIC